MKSKFKFSYEFKGMLLIWASYVLRQLRESHLSKNIVSIDKLQICFDAFIDLTVFLTC